MFTHIFMFFHVFVYTVVAIQGATIKAAFWVKHDVVANFAL